MTRKRPHPKRTIAALCTGTALSALNSGMIAVALSTLRRDFTIDVATVTWVITTYYLASAALQPIMGRLADRFGPRRLFTFGMCVIMLVGIVTPFATEFWLICAARVLLAVGTATAFPSAAAMLRSIAQDSARSAPKMIGRIQMVDTGTTAIGPVIGGLLITSVGWQAIFWINVPIAAIALVSVLMLAPADGPRTRTSLRETIVQSDIPGVLTFTAAIVALLMFLLGLPAHHTWWLIPVFFAALAGFAWRELHCTRPFIDLRLLAANTALVRVYLCFALVNLVYYSALFGLPQFLEEHGGYRADIVGTLMLPLAAFTVLLTPFVERMIDARGLRFTVIVGGIGLTFATVIMAVLAISTAPLVVLLVAAAMGIPYCILVISITQSLYVAARPEEEGEAAGIFQTARCIGGLSSTVVIGVSFSTGATPGNWVLAAGVVTIVTVCYLAIAILWRPSSVTAASSARV